MANELFCAAPRQVEALCSQTLQSIGVEDPVSQTSIVIPLPCGQSVEVAQIAYQQLLALHQANREDAAKVDQFFAEHRTGPANPPPNFNEGVAFGLLVGCSPVAPPAQAPGQDPNDPMKLRWDLPGAAEVGTLMFIRQQHFPSVSLLVGDHSISGKTVLKTGKYQEQILDYLQKYHPRHIFLEGLDQDIPPSLHDSWRSQVLSNLQEVGIQPAAKMTPEENAAFGYFLLSLLGAGIVYGLMTPNVFLHKTMTPEEGAEQLLKLKQTVAAHGGDVSAAFDDPNLFHYVFDQREVWAARELIQFYSQNPGATAILIFGASHQFCDDFQRSNIHPRIASLWWDLPGNSMSGEVPQPCR